MTKAKKPRRAGLLGGSALALVAALGSGQTLALDECGAGIPPGGTVTCTPAGNDFPNGIEYQVVDLTIIVEDGVVIDTTTKAGEPGGIVSGASGDFGDLVIEAGTKDGAGVTVTTDANSGGGIRISIDGDSATIRAYGSISTAGADAEGIFVNNDTATDITWSGSIVTTGTGSGGIDANSDGAVAVTAHGTIATSGDFSDGIIGQSINGNVLIVSDADIHTKGDLATALTGTSGGFAQVTIISDGNLITEGDKSQGIFAQSKDGQLGMIVTGAVSTAGDNSGGVEALSSAGKILISIDADVTTLGEYSTGVSAQSTGGGILVFSSGEVATAGDHSHGINAVGDKETSVTAVGGITTTGDDAVGLRVGSTLNARASNGSNITTSGVDSIGILVFSDTAKAEAYSRGNIATSGKEASGIEVIGVTEGKATVRGNISTSGYAASGVGVEAQGPVIVDAIGDIATAGDDADAIFALSNAAGGDITVTFDGDIQTRGDDSFGIRAFAVDKAEVAVSFSGSITTGGAAAIGLRAYSKEYVAVVSAGAITTTGAAATGISLLAEGDGKIALVLHGDVHTGGKTADAVVAVAENGSVAIQANGDIIAAGEAAQGLIAVSDQSVAVVVAGEVQGGWNAVGIIISSGGPAALGVEATSMVGALSDIAISDGDDGLQLSGLGAITGSAFFGKGDEEVGNGGVWNLRSFADTDGDGQRDKESVALIDFGEDKDSFVNSGVLRLSGVAGATAWDTTGQILHPGGGNADITQQGIEQGFLLGLESFAHSGLITLSDGGAGDLLVITDQADGKTKGGNVFTSNGGALALDVVLDDGSSKQSDVLILDKAELGTGATRVLVANAGGAGGQTAGDGILVVNVRDASDANAFTLGSKPVAGAYQYDLVFQNQAKTDQNWYLHSSFFEGALEYPSIVSGALLTWYSDLNGLHDRLGERRVQVADSQTAELPSATDLADMSAVRVDGGGPWSTGGGWLRIAGSDMDIEQNGSADFELNTVRAEAGFDVGFSSLIGAEDWLVLGALAGYGWSSAGFDSGSGIDFDIATVDAYATYFRGPYYLDALVKLDWLDGDFNSDNVSRDGEVALPVFGLSLETGYRLDLTWNAGWDGFYLQPQAQLSYAHSGSDSFKDDSGSRIDLENADSLRGRLGARLGRELRADSGSAVGDFHLEASVNQEFLGEAEAKVSGLTLEQELPGTTFEVGGGIGIALPKDGVTFTVDADYTFGDEANGIAATGGFRINW